MADKPDPPPRKRLRRRETGHNLRYLTFSCNQRFQLLGTPKLRAVVVDIIARERDKHGFDLIAYVVMPEHIHLMVCPAAGTLWHPVAASIKSSIARIILNRWRKLRAPILPRLVDERGRTRFWQRGGGFDRNVRTEGELEREIRYIHRNPVTRELIGAATDWDASSARFWQARFAGQIDACRDVRCDWPPEDPKAWGAWSGFM